MKDYLHYYKGSFIITAIGLAIGGFVGWEYTGTMEGALSALFLTFVLSVLEVSLSFDNAVVNATVLKDMSPKWRHRFLTWGIAIAVFGMRIVFPLAIVSIIGKMDPWSALVMAATKPQEYSEIMLSSHVALAGFGGGFLLMVALRYFFNKEKELHWIGVIERPLAKMGKVESVEIAFCLILFYVLGRFMENPQDQATLLGAGIFGTATYVLVDGVSNFLKIPEAGKHDIEKASAAAFLYLEILDASFSFDGVIGAFALTNNIFIIAAGLGIGAMFVRSMTIMLVEKETLNNFRFLEHGAFYAIGALAIMMLGDLFFHIPEVVTGLIGAVLIGFSLMSSIRYAKKHPGV